MIEMQENNPIQIRRSPPNSPTQSTSEMEYQFTPQVVQEHPRKYIDNKWVKYIMSTLLHITIQISYFSLFEPVLYFNYISIVEKNAFFHEINTITKYDDIYVDSNLIRQQQFYSMFIQFLDYENIYINEMYNHLQHDAYHASEHRLTVKDDLQTTAYTFTVISWTITILYTILFKLLYRKKSIIKYYTDHMIYIVFIGVYEIWLFRNVILKYLPWTKEELEFYLFKCFWNKTLQFYPELQCMQNNITITCSTF